MNKIVNKFSLAGDKCMPEMHLKQPGFTDSVCGPFTKNKERIAKMILIKFVFKMIGLLVNQTFSKKN